MKVAIFEYISGGGFLDKPIDTSILSEGYAMLTSILRDFKEAGHTTITILDHRIAKFNPPIKADKILTVSSSDGFEKTILKAIEYSDASLIIAPESQGTLFNLVKMVESLPTILLNSSSEAIRLCSDKGELYESLRKARIRIPNTKRCRFVDGLNSAYRVVKDIG
ncbi:MAG: hypothetical protein N3F06_04375, partial [Nitrososphaerales archaeon]|nr:hypothetical protein [Nitrososphaerales archaeon]